MFACPQVMLILGQVHKPLECPLPFFFLVTLGEEWSVSDKPNELALTCQIER